MKAAIVCSIVFLSFSGLNATAQKDPVKQANEVNEQKAGKSSDKMNVADFLVKAADARMMGTREGKLAVKQGSTQEIRDYGKLMVKDQTMLLSKIRSLAESRHITLPARISNKKMDGYQELAKEKGEDFDKKFCKMMKIDHKRDIRQFKAAADYPDDGVQSFVKAQLPLIEGHLEKLEALDK